ncbi:MAG TPA: hypothetical protein VKF36_05360 [Syntrophorhabdales bacterium]|nr:hypothetical protein [Syntrophorhabdales bacterium]
MFEPLKKPRYSERKALEAMKLVKDDILDVRKRLSKALQGGDKVRVLSLKLKK